MASYHIWHPAFVNAEPLILEAFITLGDSLFLCRGTDKFVEGALQVLQLTIQSLSWQLEAMRTPYFSSYRGSTDEWEDAWDLAWRLRITLPPDSPPVLPRPPGWGYFDLDAADGSFRPDDSPSQWAGWHCLILADAADPNTIEHAERRVKDAQPQAVCVRCRPAGRYHQLRCDLGYYPLAFYAQGALEAEAVLREISGTGASVRFTGLEE